MEYSYEITQNDDDLQVSDSGFKRFTVSVQIPSLGIDDSFSTRMIPDPHCGWVEMNSESGEMLGWTDEDIGDIIHEICNDLYQKCEEN